MSQLDVLYLCYMSEMSKWFDVHSPMSKIRKGKVSKLSVVFRSDVFNVRT